MSKCHECIKKDKTISELVEVCQSLHEHPGMQATLDIGEFHCIIDKQDMVKIQQTLNKIEGKEQGDGKKQKATKNISY